MVNSFFIMNEDKRVNLASKERKKYKRKQKGKKFRRKNKFYGLQFLGHNYRKTSQEHSQLYEASGPVSSLKCYQGVAFIKDKERKTSLIQRNNDM